MPGDSLRVSIVSNVVATRRPTCPRPCHIQSWFKTCEFGTFCSALQLASLPSRWSANKAEKVRFASPCPQSQHVPTTLKNIENSWNILKPCQNHIFVYIIYYHHLSSHIVTITFCLLMVITSFEALPSTKRGTDHQRIGDRVNQL